MRTLITILLSLLLTLGATAKTVRVKTPGTLAITIGEKQKYRLKSLKIIGPLNGDDLRFLREMAGSDSLQRPTPGRLVRVDLSQATFATGGGCYIVHDTPQHTTAPYTVPKFLFRKTIIEEVVLPVRTDTLATGALEHCRLRTIALPNGIYIANWAFNEDSLLESIVFPDYVARLGQYDFYGCKRLKHIEMHSVGHLPSHCFESEGLETFTLTGDVLHVDAEPFFNCPRLRTVEFRGTTLSTGGMAVARNCPMLTDFNFGNIMSCGFSNVLECPLLTQCKVTGQAVFGNAGSSFIPVNRQPSPQLAQAFGEALQRFRIQEPNSAVWAFLGGNIDYDLACIYALAGEKEPALAHLEKSVQAGYDDYSNIKQDSDLALLRSDERFGRLVEEVRKRGDKLLALQSAGPYMKGQKADYQFTYQPATDADLQRVRAFFNLDSIAGKGDEISQMKNIMYWLHDQIRHDGQNGIPSVPRNAIDIYKACKAEQRGLNCRGLAIMLCEMYLAMGWPARFLTCLPRDYQKDSDCHVINCVWSRTLGKWIWMDPSFAAYVSDENGLLLNQREVRQRLIDGRPLVLNDDANWNHQQKQTAEYYLQYYMAKNLYYIDCHTASRFNAENPGSTAPNPSVALCPQGGAYYSNSTWGTDVFDDDYFWQPPKEE